MHWNSIKRVPVSIKNPSALRVSPRRGDTEQKITDYKRTFKILVFNFQRGEGEKQRGAITKISI
jgi:hypothetical protein